MKFYFSVVLFTLVVALVNLVNSSTWNTFQIAHILDPATTEATNYFNWSKENWVTWLNSRDELDKIERGSHTNPRPLIKKGINSIIVASPEAVKNAYSGGIVLYKSNSKGLLYWSKDNFLVYTFKRLNNGSHEVYRCERFYIVAALNTNREPVHIDACGRTVIANYPGNFQFPWKDCARI